MKYASILDVVMTLSRGFPLCFCVRRNRRSQDNVPTSQWAITIIHVPSGADILQLHGRGILVKTVLSPDTGKPFILIAKENDKFNNKFSFSLT
jgi:hypothetical protein